MSSQNKAKGKKTNKGCCGIVARTGDTSDYAWRYKKWKKVGKLIKFASTSFHNCHNFVQANVEKIRKYNTLGDLEGIDTTDYVGERIELIATSYYGLKGVISKIPDSPVNTEIAFYDFYFGENGATTWTSFWHGVDITKLNSLYKNIYNSVILVDGNVLVEDVEALVNLFANQDAKNGWEGKRKFLTAIREVEKKYETLEKDIKTNKKDFVQKRETSLVSWYNLAFGAAISLLIVMTTLSDLIPFDTLSGLGIDKQGPIGIYPSYFSRNDTTQYTDHNQNFRDSKILASIVDILNSSFFKTGSYAAFLTIMDAMLNSINNKSILINSDTVTNVLEVTFKFITFITIILNIAIGISFNTAINLIAPNEYLKLMLGAFWTQVVGSILFMLFIPAFGCFRILMNRQFRKAKNQKKRKYYSYHNTKTHSIQNVNYSVLFTEPVIQASNSTEEIELQHREIGNRQHELDVAITKLKNEPQKQAIEKWKSWHWLELENDLNRTY
ncbi:predicted protein [Naegleria gruberi]|uniref:Predicted protein n=1 Tax=Naegleria gruberi TaxID=5762 RepID=D2W003_NAEGR|nr:uncharacterized protein NAEGRDRAFT_53624 [Naegleria gruberi]EFC37660.1 predicted protein [Naegleria gruberi]|eukprot:XP_002670404.1 predicted protein [Naegleria gruberi strain NEG-M]